MNEELNGRWGQSARARDWGDAVVVALAVGAAVLIAALVIVLFESPARIAIRHAGTELPSAAQGTGSPETDQRWR